MAAARNEAQGRYVAELLAAIYNAAPFRNKSRIVEAKDFLKRKPKSRGRGGKHGDRFMVPLRMLLPRLVPNSPS